MRAGIGIGFRDQTLRQIVHITLGGSRVRVRISNLFGSQPLEIQDVHIALDVKGAAILADSDRQVRFSGQAKVVIAPGTIATSDSVAFHLPPLANLAISMYVPDFTAPATFHASAHQTNYVATGDVSGNPDLEAPKTIGSGYFLSGVDIWNPASDGAIVALGASITEGYSAQVNDRWTDDLARSLVVNTGLPIGVLNMGISGNRLLVAGNGDSAATRFDRDVLDQSGVRWVIFSDDPINDLGMTRPPPTGGELIAALRSLIARAHARRLKFMCSTLTPFEGAAYWTAEEENAREQVNEFVRSKISGCDAIVDQDRATHDPDHPTRFLPAYDSGDHLHPNDAGHAAIAQAVPLAYFDPGGSAQPEHSRRR
jgi:lysophospholipase L1-like esterase